MLGDTGMVLPPEFVTGPTVVLLPLELIDCRPMLDELTAPAVNGKQ